MQTNSYMKKVVTPVSVTLGKKPKVKDIEDALTAAGIALPTEDAEYEMDDKKGNIHIVSYRADNDSYYYLTQELV